MDEKVIQQARALSYEIVKNEFPDEEEYFDFLFDLTIQEIQELGPGEEMEFLREMRTAHPVIALGFTPAIIILTVQLLGRFIHDSLTGEEIKNEILNKTEEISENDKERKKMEVLIPYLVEYAKERSK